MTISLYLHIGYLITTDDYGVSWGWGVAPVPRSGGKIYLHSGSVSFPWWVQPGKVKSFVTVQRMKRRFGGGPECAALKDGKLDE